MTNEFRKSITEVLDILHHMEKKEQNKVPDKFKLFLENNKMLGYKPNIDHSKNLSEMELCPDTKNILGMMYYKYWCNDNQRVEFMNKIKANEIEYQRELREKYNPDDVFKKKV